jgi:thiol:disulfide interchange protein DsbG
MQRRLLLTYGMAALAAACSKQAETPPPAAAQAPPPAGAVPGPGDAAPAYAAAKAGSGFAVGTAAAADAVLVFFDPQCPHCAELWKASLPLLSRIRMVWMPVAFIRNTSAPQGALLLAAADPLATMNQHEALLAAGQGGLAVPAAVRADLIEQVRANTALFGSLGADSVPFILYRNRRTGTYGQHAGALPTAELEKALGL